MRSRLFASLSFFVAALLVGAGAVYAYDSSRSDRIAEGITVSGVDVGGQTWGAARARIEQALLAPRQATITARYGSRRYKLTAAQANVEIDLNGSADRALARSREGNALTRTVRELAGDGVVRADVPVEVTHDEQATRRLVSRIASDLNQAAQDASVSFDGGRIDRSPSKAGLRVRTTTLQRAIDARVLALEGSRTVRVRTKRVVPEITTENVASKYPAALMVDRKGFKLTLYKNLEVAKTYGIAVGKAGLETPAGLYQIHNKAENPAWHVPNSDWAGDLAGTVVASDDPSNPIKARWLGIADGVGIHGTGDEDSIGSNASHGCIRMRVRDVKKLYPEVPVGTPIYIG